MNPYRGLALALCCLLAGATTAAGAAPRSTQDLEAVRARIEALSKSIEKDQAERDALARDVQALERRIAGLDAEVRKLEQQAASQQQRIRETGAEIVAARRSLERGEEGLRRQLRAAYVVGRGGQTQLLLNQNDVHAVGRLLVYYDYLQRAQTQALDGILGRMRELEAMSERMQAEVARLAELKAGRESSLARLKDSRSERRQALAQLRERLSDERGELKRLQADEQAIRELIERVQDTFSALPPDAAFSDQPFATLKGKLPWPARGRLIARYGEAKAGGKLSWKGHWIGADEGSPVRAVARGRVAYVGWMHRYGLLVLVEHEGGYYSLYGHANTAAVAIGDAIRAGQTIATAGSTGGHEQPGVYFELRKGKEAIDPRLWLAK